MKREARISVEQLKALLHYDPNTGKFSRIAQQTHNAGGGADCNGYLALGVMGRSYLAHRLAWLYITGQWPKFEIDHINGDRSDNRWCNLREADRQRNAQNQRRARSDNQTGFLGVTRQGSRKNPYVAKIKGRTGIVYIGRFKTAEEAHAAYVRVKRRIHEGCTI